jgi:hypothetical protein
MNLKSLILPVNDMIKTLEDTIKFCEENQLEIKFTPEYVIISNHEMKIYAHSFLEGIQKFQTSIFDLHNQDIKELIENQKMKMEEKIDSVMKMIKPSFKI